MDFPSWVVLVFSVKRGWILNQCAEVKLSLFFLFVLTEKISWQRSFNFVCACTCFSFTRMSLSSESLFGTPRRRADLCLFGLRKARNGDSRSDNSSSEPGEFWKWSLNRFYWYLNLTQHVTKQKFTQKIQCYWFLDTELCMSMSFLIDFLKLAELSFIF